MKTSKRVIIGRGILALLATMPVSSLLLGSQELDLIYGPPLSSDYKTQIDRQLDVPRLEQDHYGRLAFAALTERDALNDSAQFVLVVDRCPLVQAVMLYWISKEREFHFVGASPVSTGKPGMFEYFQTPLGVFEHTIRNQDFRAEGTRNKNGIRGYGLTKGHAHI